MMQWLAVLWIPRCREDTVAIVCYMIPWAIMDYWENGRTKMPYHTRHCCAHHMFAHMPNSPWQGGNAAPQRSNNSQWRLQQPPVQTDRGWWTLALSHDQLWGRNMETVKREKHLINIWLELKNKCQRKVVCSILSQNCNITYSTNYIWYWFLLCKGCQSIQVFNLINHRSAEDSFFILVYSRLIVIIWVKSVLVNMKRMFYSCFYLWLIQIELLDWKKCQEKHVKVPWSFHGDMRSQFYTQFSFSFFSHLSATSPNTSAPTRTPSINVGWQSLASHSFSHTRSQSVTMLW